MYRAGNMQMEPHIFGTMTKGVKVKTPARRSKKLSLKYRGIVARTRKRHEAQLKIFFSYLDAQGWKLWASWGKLDTLVADYIDHMFQEEVPVGYAGDLLSGLARWLPGSRNRMPTARLWFRNWMREVVRRPTTCRVPLYAQNQRAVFLMYKRCGFLPIR